MKTPKLMLLRLYQEVWYLIDSFQASKKPLQKYSMRFILNLHWTVIKFLVSLMVHRNRISQSVDPVLSFGWINIRCTSYGWVAVWAQIQREKFCGCGLHFSSPITLNWMGFEFWEIPKFSSIRLQIKSASIFFNL